MRLELFLSKELIQRCDAYAEPQGIDRDTLFSCALAELLERYRQDVITAQLNRVYAQEDSTLLHHLELLSDEVLRTTLEQKPS